MPRAGTTLDKIPLHRCGFTERTILYGVGYIHQRHGTERDGKERTKVGSKVVTYLEVYSLTEQLSFHLPPSCR